MIQQLVPILSAGHGKMINGIYQTAGKQSPKWSKGILYEGMFNNWVINRIIEKLDRKRIPYYHCNPEYKDVSMTVKDARIKKIWNTNRNVYLFETHANGGGGKGVEGFTTPGYTLSDPIGEKFLVNIEKRLTEQKMRFDFSDGDRDKEANFYMLRKPPCPCFLLEAGFMDQMADYHNLWDENYLTVLVDAIVEVMEDLYINGI